MSKGMSPTALLREYLDGHLAATLRAYEEMGMVYEHKGELEASGRAVLETVAKTYPALMILGTGLGVWVNVVLAKPLFRLKRVHYPEHFSTERWRAPEGLVWVVIASGFAFFFSSGGIRWFAVNVLMVTLAAHLFQGFCITLFYLKKYHVPRWVCGVIFVMLVIQQLLLVVLLLGGIFDQWIDFRKIHKRMET
jgi:uncharacterized protein YybS (DUF2232 family)